MLVSGISGTQQNVSQLKIDGSWYPKGLLLKERVFSAEWHSHLRQLSLMDFLGSGGHNLMWREQSPA